MSISLFDRYAEKVTRGDIERDNGQDVVLRKLDQLRSSLASDSRAQRSKSIGRLLRPKPIAAPLRGLYIWGAVGRGKTMLMDLFFEAAPVARKRRVHFHAFMADVHARIHALRQELLRQDARRGAGKCDDPIAAAADAIAETSSLLCFDEFNVTDIADAMILGRLFAALFARGVVIVATSNVKPDELYRDGLNRALFLPFISLIEDKMEVVRLEARADFRLEKLQDRVVYHVPPNAKSAAALTSAFKALTGAERGLPMTLDVLGRALAVPEALANVARFSFTDLCAAALGPADYLAIARQFHTVIVDSIPALEAAQRNEARRFITLIDTLYDRHVKLIASAEAEPADLYQAAQGREAHEFARTASRLIEMRSAAYLGLPHGSLNSFGSGDASGLVET
ncbi:cell division protein ZapE [Methylocapsa polymorpha]|uniref:Cell division protein ZapE n=1 Tax=Methylocapsa polymorpha TaxID=3080828 RepID=A0ABZ0HVH6_9HYPH|nr:cell division protein ZapE [Methylocapsa sp. RX1]